MVKDASDKISGYVSEILNDLHNNSCYLSFIKSTERNKLKKFIIGLKDFSGWIGYSCSDCDKCKAFLELSESNSKRLSRASESDIDKAINVMYNGGKSNVYSSDRLSLVEKAYKSGISWTVGNDINKKNYLNEVVGRYDQKFLGDVYHKYMFKYKIHEKLIGRNYKNIFSDEYISYYEKKIFGTELSRHYISSGTYNYMQFFKEKVLWIINKLNSDFDRGARGSHFVKFDNFNRIKIAALSLKKLGADITYVLLNLKRFETTDVTDKLMNIFREAKRDGEALKARYPLAFNNMSEIVGVSTCAGFEEIYYESKKYYIDFINLVKSWGPYDIKRRCGWIRDLQYMFDGKIINYDDTGNMAYGVLAKAAGMDRLILHGGAGAYNLIEACGIKDIVKNFDKHELSQFSEKFSEGWKVEKHWITSLFDDPNDWKAIELGLKYYDRL